MVRKTTGKLISHTKLKMHDRKDGESWALIIKESKQKSTIKGKKRNYKSTKTKGKRKLTININTPTLIGILKTT